MKSCLIFDLDGTLVDSLTGIADSLNRALEQFELPPHHIEDVRTFVGDGARILIERAAPSADARTLAELEEYFKEDYRRAWATGTAPFAGIAEALQILVSRHLLAVLSNKPHEFTVKIVEQLFPDIQFAAILGQRAGTPHKPDPAGALEILHSLDIPLSNCRLIGDSTIDLETAQRAGVHAIAVTWGYHDPEALKAMNPLALISTPRELAQL